MRLGRAAAMFPAGGSTCARNEPPPDHSTAGSTTTRFSLGVSGMSVPSRGKATTGTLAPRRNCSSTRFRIAGLTSRSSSSEARRSFTTFFIVGW